MLCFSEFSLSVVGEGRTFENLPFRLSLDRDVVTVPWPRPDRHIFGPHLAMAFA